MTAKSMKALKGKDKELHGLRCLVGRQKKEIAELKEDPYTHMVRDPDDVHERRIFNLGQENKGLRNALYDRKVEVRTMDRIITMLAEKVRR